jgi:acyl-CoA synthetase (AMP-forming)/AMP-acid ligase II
LRYGITMGEPCTPELATAVAARFGVPVSSAYGMTECLTGIGHLRRDLLAGTVKPGSCGTLCFGDVRLIDAQGREDPSFGELWVSNPTVHACYLDPSLNDERLRDGWFRTGDLFFRDDDGHFFHRGRSDDMFVHNGKNVYPAELEAVLMKHPDVEQVCAVPIRGADDAALPAVLIRSKRELSAGEVLDFSAKNGASHAIPKLVAFTDGFPEAGPGKIDRAAVVRRLQADFDRAPT